MHPVSLLYFVSVQSVLYFVASPDRVLPALQEVCSRFPEHPLCGSRNSQKPTTGTDSSSLKVPPVLPPETPNQIAQAKPANLLEAEDFCRRYRDAYDTESKCRDANADDIFCRVFLKTCRPIYLGGVSNDAYTVTRAPLSGDIAQTCWAYKSPYETFCTGSENSQTRRSCMQYREYCLGRAFPPKPATRIVAPPGSDEYCEKYTLDYTNHCNTGSSVASDWRHFCSFYFKLCTLVAEQKLAPLPINPNFGGPFNPILKPPQPQINPTAPPVATDSKSFIEPPSISEPGGASSGTVPQGAPPLWPGLGSFGSRPLLRMRL